MTAAKNWIGEKSIHNNYSEFARGYIEYKVGNNGYVADVVVGIKENGTAVLYDLTNIYEKEIAETSYTDKEKSKSSRSDASADNNIPQSSENSNTDSETKDKKSKNDAFYFDDDGDLFFGDKAARESEVRFGKSTRDKIGLSSNEWRRFYQIIDNNHKSLMIGKTGIILDDDRFDNIPRYTLICYDGNKENPTIKAVYKIENFDYNIYNQKRNIINALVQWEEKGLNVKQIRKALRNLMLDSEGVFKRYNKQSHRFNRLTTTDRRDNQQDLQCSNTGTTRASVSENAGESVSGTYRSEQLKGKKSKNDAFYFDDDGDLFFGDKAARESEVRYRKYGSKYGKFDKSLSKNEWASFYASIQEYNQRDSFRIGDNGIIIPNKKDTNSCKLVIYKEETDIIDVLAVYKLEQFDYNIHIQEKNPAEIIAKMEKDGYDEIDISAALQRFTDLYGQVFKKYRYASGSFYQLTRRRVQNGRNSSKKSSGDGIQDGFEKGISGSDTSEQLKGKKSKNDAWAEGDDGKIYSQNFKEWFGDWLNNPQNASKVVDKDGKPLVVYHQTASDFTKYMSNPDTILLMDNGRLNLVSTISDQKNKGVISIELNTVKDINNKYNAYNLVISVFTGKNNYIRNNIKKHAVAVKYEKDDLSQVNPQLYEWLAIINDKSSFKNNIPQSSENSNTNSETKDKKIQE